MAWHDMTPRKRKQKPEAEARSQNTNTTDDCFLCRASRFVCVCTNAMLRPPDVLCVRGRSGVRLLRRLVRPLGVRRERCVSGADDAAGSPMLRRAAVWFVQRHVWLRALRGVERVCAVAGMHVVRRVRRVVVRRGGAVPLVQRPVPALERRVRSLGRVARSVRDRHPRRVLTRGRPLVPLRLSFEQATQPATSNRLRAANPIDDVPRQFCPSSDTNHHDRVHGCGCDAGACHGF
jgi:hypothetical protein